MLYYIILLKIYKNRLVFYVKKLYCQKKKIIAINVMISDQSYTRIKHKKCIKFCKSVINAPKVYI